MNLSTKLLHASMHHKITLCDDIILHNCKIMQRSTKKVIMQQINETILDDFIGDMSTVDEIAKISKFFGV